ncbi:MAG: hypothetical protein HFG76_13030 [Hungatella sp.]|nr:hypothetical protein [Hungatella sp.]
MIKQYKTSNSGVDFTLIFHDTLTIISGEAGIGKTILFKALENDSILGNINAICLNYDDITSGIIDITLKSSRNKVIVIDNADVILTAEQKLKVSMDQNNQYIIFAHSIQGMHPAEKSIAELEVKDNKGTLNYVLL